MNGLTLRTPTDVLSAVPYLFGFHPADSVVALALHGKQFVCQVRVDTPPPAQAARLAAHVTEALLRHHPTAAIIVGYGPAEPTDTALAALESGLETAGVSVADVVRADRGRYWRTGCTDSGCCPPEGIPYDPTVTEFAAQATYAGISALPTREDMVALLSPVDGPGIEPELERAAERLRAVSSGGTRKRRAAGRAAVTEAFDTYHAGRHLDDAATAWLALLLTDTRVRDDAWQRIVADGPAPAHAELWRDLLRRVPQQYVPAPATLFGLCAWRRGDLVGAGMAVQRVLEIDPGYRLAELLGQALLAGLSPTLLDDRPTPAVSRRQARASAG